VTLEEERDAFIRAAGKGGFYAFAPGRGNLIGEHIDYSGGTVAPVTIGAGCFCAAIPADGLIARNLSGERHDGQQLLSPDVSLPVDALFSHGDTLLAPERVRGLLSANESWAGLLFGAVYVLLEERLLARAQLKGMRFLIRSDVPIGAGLSSSAALEVSGLAAASACLGITLSGKELARLAQRVEHALRGVPCGRMDQSAAALGKEREVLALDCSTWETRSLALPKGWSPLFVHTGIPRSLATSAYAERRAACERGLRKLNAAREKKGERSSAALCALSPEEFASLPDAGLSAEEERRCRHAIDEQSRVRRFIAELRRKKRPEVLGSLLFASHRSLRDLYEVSCPELDALVEIARGIGISGGVAGARLQGAGFGGCAVLLIESSRVEEVSQRVSEEYRRTGKRCSFHAGSSPGSVAFGTHPLGGEDDVARLK